MAQGEQATSHTGGSSNQSSTTGAGGDWLQVQVVVDDGESTFTTDFAQRLATKLQENKNVDEPGKSNLESKPPSKIQRVPQILREVESSTDCYEPLLISLGPYHHGKPRLKEMEKIKISMMQRFVHESRYGEAAVHRKFLEVARNAQTEYYVLEPPIDDMEFLCILYVDVCFLIQFLIQFTHGGNFGNMTINEIFSVLRDIFLLENQLPFPIIEALMMLRPEKEELYEMINEFTSFVPNAISGNSYGQTQMRSERDVWTFRPDTDAKPAHILHALQMKLVGVGKKKILTDEEATSDLRYTYPSVSDLKAAGVQFRLQRGRRHLTDMRFAGRTFALSQMVIGDRIKASLLNLCAFEALPVTPDDDSPVTSYLWFMGKLIRNTDDVKELRTQRILINDFAGDQQAVDFFGDQAGRLVPNPDAYAQVMSEIDKHCKSHMRTWIAQFLQNHFSTPWGIFAFLLAGLAVVLSLVQTYFSIHPRA